MTDDPVLARHEANLEKATALSTDMAEKQMAYTNTVVITGYAGYFGLWQISKDLLNPAAERWSAFFVLLSLIGFVGFELIRMITVQKIAFRNVAAMTSEEARLDPQVWADGFARMAADNRRILARFMRFWQVSIYLVIGTAIAGTAILVAAFAHSLITGRPLIKC